MGKYQPFYNGHIRNQRIAVIQLGLKTESELALLSDEEVAKLINDSGCFVFQCGEDVALLPKEYSDKLVWIGR